ncbi:MAG: hypothetical protein ABSA75_11630 [Candidatus Bathyarchaeia archaeon]|jgi:hypothetical protein
MSEEIVLGGYKLSKFDIVDNAIRFVAIPISGEVSVGDKAIITETICNNLGKWESLMNTALNIFSELGISQPTEEVLKNYEKPFGMELYQEPSVNKESLSDIFWVFISLNQQERIKRKNAKLDPILTIDEIVSQLRNIPKWIAFEKTLKTVKNQWH